MAPTFSVFAVLLATVSLACGKIYFKEDFNSKDWETRWTTSSKWKPAVRAILNGCLLDR